VLSAPSFKYFNVAIADPNMAVEATSRQSAEAEPGEMRVVRELSSREIDALSLKAGDSERSKKARSAKGSHNRESRDREKRDGARRDRLTISLAPAGREVVASLASLPRCSRPAPRKTRPCCRLSAHHRPARGRCQARCWGPRLSGAYTMVGPLA
jgi:hypothetical protein